MGLGTEMERGLDVAGLGNIALLGVSTVVVAIGLGNVTLLGVPMAVVVELGDWRRRAAEPLRLSKDGRAVLMGATFVVSTVRGPRPGGNVRRRV